MDPLHEKINKAIKEIQKPKPIYVSEEIKHAFAGALDAYLASWVGPVKKTYYKTVPSFIKDTKTARKTKVGTYKLKKKFNNRFRKEYHNSPVYQFTNKTAKPIFYAMWVPAGYGLIKTLF